MNTTIRIFDNDAYKQSLTAKVLSCEKAERDGTDVYQVVLDQTVFFPEGGGQSPDKGTINGNEVIDVQIKNDVITHTMTVPVEVGTEVLEELNWEHRFSNMQQHSGEHIFSGLVHEQYGYNNVGFHLSDQIVTMDFSGPLTEEQVQNLEMQVNDCIAKNMSVEVTYPSDAELEKLEYRSKIEIDGQVRIITIPGYDVCACCGTHVARTGEIGIFKVVGTQNYKGGIRISLLCGFRALADYRKKQESVVHISNSLSVKQEEVAEAVEKMKQDISTLKQELNVVKANLMLQKVSQVDTTLTNVCLFEEGLDADTMRTAVNALTEVHAGFCGIFVGNDADGYRYIIGSKENDAREMGNLLREKFAAKGGGKPAMIQGSLNASRSEIEGLFA